VLPSSKRNWKSGLSSKSRPQYSFKTSPCWFYSAKVPSLTSPQRLRIRGSSATVTKWNPTGGPQFSSTRGQIHPTVTAGRDRTRYSFSPADGADAAVPGSARIVAGVMVTS
jgi:hypothetical protein